VTAVGARRLGAVGVVTLLVGIGIGMLVAPTSGAQLRARLRTLVGGTGALPDGEVRVAVQRELSAAPRTWHLPQPEVAVHGGVVTLRGTVPHDTARLEVEAAAAGVRGVQGVVNDLVVA
jgi:osmotically-inducible protein OsmY